MGGGHRITIILSGKRLIAFSLQSGIRQGYPLIPFPLNTVLEVIARFIRKEKEMKYNQTEKREVK